MKKLISVLTIALTVVLSTASFAQNTDATNGLVSIPKETQFGVYPLANGKIEVTTIKPENTKLTIQVKDASGVLLVSKLISKNSATNRTRFDLSALPDGVYQIIFLEGNNKEMKHVILNTQTAETTRTVKMS